MFLPNYRVPIKYPNDEVVERVITKRRYSNFIFCLAINFEGFAFHIKMFF
jgi:hypothetical protein